MLRWQNAELRKLTGGKFGCLAKATRSGTSWEAQSWVAPDEL